MAPVLLESQRMKIAMIALFALACSGTVWAGSVGPRPTLPDTGSSIVLLSMGVAVVGAVRGAFRR